MGEVLEKSSYVFHFFSFIPNHNKRTIHLHSIFIHNIQFPFAVLYKWIANTYVYIMNYVLLKTMKSHFFL